MMMMTTNKLIPAATMALLLLAADATAQPRWAVGARAGLAVPTQAIEGEDFGAGVGVEGSLRYRLSSGLSAYAGWDWTRFSSGLTLGETEADFEETGYVFGFRLEHTFSDEDGPTLWLRGGPTLARVEIEDLNGDFLADTGRSSGWEVGGGVGFSVGQRLSLVPGVRYRSSSHDVEIDGISYDFDLGYVSFEAGAAMIF